MMVFAPDSLVVGVGSQEVVKRVQPLLLEPDFTYAVMRTKSAAAANLCNWVINIINFNQVHTVYLVCVSALLEY